MPKKDTNNYKSVNHFLFGKEISNEIDNEIIKRLRKLAVERRDVENNWNTLGYDNNILRKNVETNRVFSDIDPYGEENWEQ